MHKKTSRYIAYLATLAAVPALSTDMYLAAIPQISAEWEVPTELITLTLTLWFTSFSIGLLFSGSLSDKFGRRHLVIYGISGFVISTLLCAFSTSPYMLIICRIAQGLSASAPSSMAMAICRDRFDGNSRKIALAYIGIMLSLAPILAPPIGSVILTFGNWRGIFICQAMLGIIVFILSLRYTETNKSLINQPIHKLLGRYLVLFKNKGYVLSTLTLGFLTGPFYGYIAFAPIVYVSIYGASIIKFSVLFSLTAFCSVLGAFSFTKLNNKVKDTTIISICFIGIIASGVGVITLGYLSYHFFFAFAAAIAFFTGMSRPVSNSLILGFVDTDIGSASSFMIFYQFIIGSLCMSYSSYNWQVSSPIVMFGILTVAIALLSLLVWLSIKKLSSRK